MVVDVDADVDGVDSSIFLSGRFDIVEWRSDQSGGFKRPGENLGNLFLKQSKKNNT